MLKQVGYLIQIVKVIQKVIRNTYLKVIKLSFEPSSAYAAEIKRHNANSRKLSTKMFTMTHNQILFLTYKKLKYAAEIVPWDVN